MVWLKHPGMPVAKVGSELLILFRPHIAGPDDLRRVNVRGIVDVLVIHVVFRTIAHKHQLASGLFAQAVNDSYPYQISPWPGWLDLRMSLNCDHPKEDHGHAHYRDFPN